MEKNKDAPEEAHDDHYTLLKSDHQRHQRKLFVDANEMKAKLIEQLSKPEYCVSMYYHEHGRAQEIAKALWFEQLTLAIITFNALWIFIDTDYNPSDVMTEAPVGFQIVDQCFCFYFVLEWLIRFLAFKRKLNCIRDSWFVFDTLLMLFYVMDSWVFNLIVLIQGGGSAGAFGNTSIIRVFRLLRLTRMARMARILKAVPELAILVKGMGAAMRSVVFTLTLLLVLLYIFGIMFRHLCSNHEDSLCAESFPSVPKAAHTLLVHGAFMDSLADFVGVVEEYSLALLFLFYIFLLLASTTVMNMLIGILCDVITSTAEMERESLTINYVKERLHSIMLRAGQGKFAQSDSKINKEEFLQIIQNNAAAAVLSEVGVDVVGLVDFAEFIFKEDLFELQEDEVKVISFAELVEVVLELRGNNTATVRDVVDLRKFLHLKVTNLENKLDALASMTTRRSSLSSMHDHGRPSLSGNPVAQDASEAGNPTLHSIQDHDEELLTNSNSSMLYRGTDAVTDVYKSLLRKTTADSSLFLVREDATLFCDFKRLVDRMVLDNQIALSTLQRGNERLQAELSLLKSFGTPFADTVVEGKISQLSRCVSLTSDSLDSLQHTFAAVTAKPLNHQKFPGKDCNNHVQEAVEHETRWFKLDDEQDAAPGDQSLQNMRQPAATGEVDNVAAFESVADDDEFKSVN